MDDKINRYKTMFRITLNSLIQSGEYIVYTSYVNGLIYVNDLDFLRISQDFGTINRKEMMKLIKQLDEDIDIEKVIGVHIGLRDFDWRIFVMVCDKNDPAALNEYYNKICDRLAMLEFNESKVDEIFDLIAKHPILNLIKQGYFAISDLGIHGDCLNFAIALWELVAKKNNDWDIVAIFSKDVNEKSDDGFTALKVAKKHGYTEIVNLLRSAGAQE